LNHVVRVIFYIRYPCLTCDGCANRTKPLNIPERFQASLRKYFTSRLYWLLVFKDHVSSVDLETYFLIAKPQFFNITVFFTAEFEQTVKVKELGEMNDELNEELLRDLEEEDRNYVPVQGEIPERVRIVQLN